MRDAVANSIIEHYADFDEDTRLQGAFGELESLRTREVIRDAIPAPPAALLDLGGGTGAYSFWLAELGYQVDLVDLVPRHVEAARRRQTLVSFPLRTIEVGDARSLDLPDANYDAVVLHGPLYHFPDPHDRRAVLEECRRVLRPSGRLVAFSITRLAGLFYALAEGLLFDDSYRRMIRSEIRTGTRGNRPSTSRTFSSAYFHEPHEILAEVREVGFESASCGGVAGPVWQTRDFESAWRDPNRREVLLEVSRDVAFEPAISPSICIQAQKAAAV